MQYLNSNQKTGENMANGFTIWLTGHSGAGKSTLAHALEKELTSRHISTENLDGDVVRIHLSQGLTFSPEDRNINVQRIGFVASLLSKHGVGVIVSAISPYRAARESVRKSIPGFVEVYVNCPVEECERRDVKGLYKKARNGEIPSFTGINDPYEPPLNPEVEVRTDLESLHESTGKIISFLEKQNLIGEIK
ncbi:MAG: adenylyl-sulfate kinase [Bacteroidetes bacterium]|nr:adenylyl-sulfate kinase [Bacteroidota bacterium]